MKKMKRIACFILSLILITVLLPLGTISVNAEGPEADGDVFEDTNYEVGDYIKFGHYEQDGNTSNGKEEIEWQILKVESDRILVISRYALDAQPFHSELIGIKWESCALRKWLNNDFKNEAFSQAEQKVIPTVTVINKTNPESGFSSGANTKDQIFCLSFDEIETYFGEYNWYDNKKMSGFNQKLICDATPYAINRGAWVYSVSEKEYNTDLKDKGYSSDVIGCRGSYWWLRTTGFTPKDACIVHYNGEAGAGHSLMVHYNFPSVRPALYISYSDNNPQPYKPNPQPYHPKPQPIDITNEVSYMGYTTTFHPSELRSSRKYNQKLAELCALLSEAAYHNDGADVKNVLKQAGIYHFYQDYTVESSSGIPPINWFMGDLDKHKFCYSIGYQSMTIDGVDTNVVFFVLRGTYSYDEAMGDHYTDARSWRYQEKYPVYGIVKDFLDNVQKGMGELAKKPELNDKPMKFVITGHSLGGATANLLGAAISDTDSPLSDRDDVFVYTFGSIDSIGAWSYIYDSNYSSKGSISSGYENIHNIYNYHDSYGPYGWPSFTAAGASGYGKFGHIDIFAYDKDQGENAQNKNHMMVDTYIPAVFGKLDGVKIVHDKEWRIVSMHCPVDVNVYQNGKLAASITNDTVDYSLTAVPAKVIGDEKYFLIDSEADYSFEIIGTAEGTMEYDIQDAETGNETKGFQTVSLNPDKTMISYVDSDIKTENVKLFIENEAGKIVTEVKEDGEEIPANVQSIFKDVTDGSWYIPSVQYVYDKDIMTGKGSKFAPNTPLRREEFTQILFTNEGRPDLTISENPFDDVKDAWYKNSVLWAKEKNIVSGKSENYFGIGKNITREELALMLYKYAQYKNYDVNVDASTDLSGFTDAGIVSDWALEAVKWAVDRGIISGKGNATDGYRIDPGKGATRAECATMIKKYIEIHSGALQIVPEEEEEPLALPEENIEDLPIPGDDTEDNVDDEYEEKEDIVDDSEENQDDNEEDRSEDVTDEPG